MSNSTIYSQQSVQRELAKAIRQGNYFEAKYLILRQDADPNGCEYYADSPRDPDPEMQDEGIPIAEYTGLNCDDYHIFQLLFEHGMDPTRTLIGCMKSANFIGALVCLLHGADINARDENGRPQLINYILSLMQYPMNPQFSDHCCVVVMIYHNEGYIDEKEAVKKLLERTDIIQLHETLYVAQYPAADLEHIFANYRFDYNVAFPNKNPSNYFSGDILTPFDEPEYHF